MKTVVLNGLKKSLFRTAFIGKTESSFSSFTGKGCIATLLQRTFSESLNGIEHVVTLFPITIICNIAGSVLSFFNQFQKRIFLQLFINPLFKVQHRKLKELTA